MESIRDRLKKTIDLSLKKNEPTESYYNNMDAFNSNAKDNIETYARALLIALDALDVYADRDNYRFIERDNPNNGMRARAAKEKIEKLFEVGHD